VLCVIATFLAYAPASLTFSPLDRLTQRNPPAPAATIGAEADALHLDEP